MDCIEKRFSLCQDNKVLDIDVTYTGSDQSNGINNKDNLRTVISKLSVDRQQGIIAKPNDLTYTGIPIFRFGINSSSTQLVLTNYLGEDGEPITIDAATAGVLTYTGEYWEFTAFPGGGLPIDPPQVSLGDDKTTTTSSVVLTSTVIPTTGQFINGYQWSLVSGSLGSTFLTPNAQNTTVTGLINGEYTFKLKVTQSDTQTGEATVKVTVNIPPTATYYWGWKADGAIPADPTTLQHNADHVVGSNITANFMEYTTAGNFFMAEPITEQPKTIWYVSALNTSSIDTVPGGSNTWYYVEQGNWRIYATNYITLFTEAAVQFKIS